MRKFLSTTFALTILLLPMLFVFAANQSVQVSAIVDMPNHPPVVLSVLPASDPKLLGQNKIQNYSVYFRDDEKDTVIYTITPASGYTNTINGTITSYDTASGAYITFTYLSPTTVASPGPTSITLTLDDGQLPAKIIQKNLNLYIY